MFSRLSQVGMCQCSPAVDVLVCSTYTWDVGRQDGGRKIEKRVKERLGQFRGRAPRAPSFKPRIKNVRLFSPSVFPLHPFTHTTLTFTNPIAVSPLSALETLSVKRPPLSYRAPSSRPSPLRPQARLPATEQLSKQDKRKISVLDYPLDNRPRQLRKPALPRVRSL